MKRMTSGEKASLRGELLQATVCGSKPGTSLERERLATIAMDELELIEEESPNLSARKVQKRIRKKLRASRKPVTMRSKAVGFVDPVSWMFFYYAAQMAFLIYKFWKERNKAA